MFEFFKRVFNTKGKAHFRDRNVLVGIARSADQYEANIAHNFYHIPADRIYSLDMPVKYVAIFKPGRFFPLEETGVYVYGKIKKTSIVPRYAIRELPKDSYEEYLRFDVEEWINLPSPIPQGEISRTQTFTTFDILLNAKSATELYLPDKNAIGFFRFLERECSKANSTDFAECEYNEIGVAFTDEYIELVYPNAFHTRYKREQFYQRPYALYHEILH